MTSDAVKMVQQAIDEARADGYADGQRKGYAEGYAAAMQAMQEFLRSSSATPRRTAKTDEIASAPRGRIRDDINEYVPKTPRYVSQLFVAEAYQGFAPEPASPTQVLHWIKREKGKELPFTSLRRAIEALEKSGHLVEIGDSRTWRWAGLEFGASILPIRPTGTN